MTDEAKRHDHDATQALSPGAVDPLAAPPSGGATQPSLVARRPGSTSLPASTLVLLGVALLVVGGVIGALVGHRLGGSSAQQVSAARTGRAGNGFAGGFGGRPGGAQGGQPGGPGQGGGFTAGTVTKVDGDTITVKQQDGSTAVIKVTGSTTVTVTKAGSSADVAVGEPVVAAGQAGSDGSVTARTLRVGDQGGFGRGRATGSAG